jgi:pimeloyl-ACP methyl ester carboxylesterase
LYRRDGDAVVIFCHSALRGGDHLDAERLLAALPPRFDLITFDFRGHHASFGISTMGGDEILDVRAVIGFAHAERYPRLALLGAGMGATAAGRAAMVFGNVDALVAVSPSGFASEFAPLVAQWVEFLMIDTAYGEVSLRLIANTRLRPRELAGFPADIALGIAPPPTLVILARDDRQVKLDRFEELMEERFPDFTLRLVDGREHAEDLLDGALLAEAGDGALLAEAGAFLDSAVPPPAGTGASPAEPVAIRGEVPIPETVARNELRAGAQQGATGAVAQRLREVLAFHGYALASVSTPDSTGAVTVKTPRIRHIELQGNRHVSDDHLLSVLNIGGGYFNAYELDTAVRRVSGDPAVRAVHESIRRRPDGDIDVTLDIQEVFPARFFATAKFTDIDQFYGAGVTWNELNPTSLQLEGRVLYGREGGRFLSETRVGKYTLANTLFLSVAHYNMIRSRDELAFVYTRQEVHNVGGEVASRYRVSQNVALELGAFVQRDREPEGSPELPVTEGDQAGGTARLDVAGRLPLQGPPWLTWRQTLYYRNAGMFDHGDFSFDTYQWNLSVEVPVAPHISTLSTAHAGRVTAGAPPQNLLSLGGMHTFPGYEDDEFVDSRMALASFGLYISARRWVDETSRWAPLRLIVSGHVGTVWGRGQDYGARHVATDVMLEVDYRKLARVGYVIPTGGLRDLSEPRIFVGWGEHVQW